MNWQPIETSPKKRDVLIGAWVYEGPVLGWSWKQTVASRYGIDWTLSEAGSYAQDYDCGFNPEFWCELPEPPKNTKSK